MKNNTKKSIYSLLLGIITTVASAQQTISSRWQDYFAYNNIKSIRQNNEEVLAATSSGLFYYNPSNQTYRKFSKVQGLHEVEITAFDINPKTGQMLIGYASGNLDVVENGKITYIIDIPRLQSFTGDKSINHINIKDNRALVSTNYGFSIFDLDRKEFKDSALFTENNNAVPVSDAVFYNNSIYIITSKGLLSHPEDNTLGIYRTWKEEQAGNFVAISSGDTVFAATATQVFSLNNNVFGPVIGAFTNIQDIKANGDDLVVTEANKVKYFKNLVLQNTVDYTQSIRTANLVNGKIYAGTLDAGLIDDSQISRKPDGPYNNKTTRMTLHKDQIWANYGVRADYNSSEPSLLGYYHFDGKQWQYPEMFTKGVLYNIMEVAPQPNDPSIVYFTNYIVGGRASSIYKMQNNILLKEYKTHPDNAFFNLPVGISFDNNNNLFVSNGINPESYGPGMGVYNASKDIFEYKPTYPANAASHFMSVKDGVLLIPTPRGGGGGGILCYNYNNSPTDFSDDSLVRISTDQNMPIDQAICSAIDKDNKVWIGTEKGLRFVNFSEVKKPGLKTKYVVIMQDNRPEELFKDLEIESIAVDGANNKWLAIAGGGVYQISPDGEKTLKIFNLANSPLPDDTVHDIKIDDASGKIYFATSSGIVSYQTDIANLNKDFNEVIAYPNPLVTSTYKGGINFKGLAEKSNIRIVDVAGNLVHQATVEGGVYEWDLTIATGDKLASGIYFALMTNADGSSSAKVKFAVIN